MAKTKDTPPKFEDTEPLFEDTMPLSDSDRAAVSRYISAPQKTTEGEALLGGAQQGLTLGHADELGGAMGAAMEAPGQIQKGMKESLASPNSYLEKTLEDSKFNTQNKPKSVVDLYKEYRDMQRKQFKTQEQEHPADFAAGNLGGGILGTVGGGMALKGLGMAGQAAQAPTMAARMRQGAALGAGIGAVAGEGNSEAPLLSKQMAGDVVEGAENGATTGAVLTPAVEGASAAAKGTASAIKNGAQKIGEATLPDTPGAFMRGFGKTGRASREWLVGPKAAQETSQMMYDTGGEIPVHIENQLNQFASQKQAIIDTASEKGVKIDPNQIDEFIHKYAGNDPNNIDPKVNSELADFHNLLKNAKDGNEVEKVTRVFFGNGNTERGQFAQLFAQKQAEHQAAAAPDVIAPQTEKEAFEKLFAQKQAEQQAIPGSNPNPLELHYEPIDGDPDAVLGVVRQKVSGDSGGQTYKKVASKLVDPNNEDEMQAMEDLLNQKQAEQKAIPGSDPTPLELHMEDTGIDGKQLAVIRQKQIDEGGSDTYRKVFSKRIEPDAVPSDLPKLEMILQPLPDQPGKSLGVIRQAVLDDKGNISGYKIIAKKALNNEDAALFRDMSDIVRVGDRDLSDPKQLLDLYKTLKSRSTYGDTSYKQPAALEQVANATKDIQSMLRGSNPELEGIDQKISSLNQAKESVGLDGQKTSAELTDPNTKKIIGNLIVKSTGEGTESIAAKERLQNLVAKLKEVDPEYAQRVESKIADLQDRAKTTEAVQEKAYARKWTATPRAWMNKGANVAGYGVGYIMPDTMRNVAGKMMQGTGVARDVAKVLMKAADADDQGRNALMFGLLQNPAYNKTLKEYLPQDEEDQK